MEAETHRICISCILNEFLSRLGWGWGGGGEGSINAYELSDPKCLYFSEFDSN